MDQFIDDRASYITTLYSLNVIIIWQWMNCLVEKKITVTERINVLNENYPKSKGFPDYVICAICKVTFLVCSSLNVTFDTDEVLL